MEFEIRDVVTHARPRVYRALRDELPALVPHLPEVVSIDVLERQDGPDGRVRILNRWRGSLDKAPRVVRPFLKPEMASWLDHAEWDDAAHSVRWRLEPAVCGSLFECRGTNYVEEQGEGAAVIRITGQLDVFPERVPGVPRLLARGIKEPIESFVIGLVKPNLRDLSRGLQRYLDAVAPRDRGAASEDPADHTQG